MKKPCVVCLLVVCCVFSGARGAGRINQSITITAGTPVHIAASGTIADEILILPAPGATVSAVYVMAGATNRTPAKTNGPDVTAKLCPATATLAGCSYSDGTLVQQSTGVDVGAIWIDADTTGTVVIVSYQPR